MFGFQLVYNYPAWYFLLCLLAGVSYALVLYYRNKHDDFSKKTIWLLSATRFVAVSLIAILLLGILTERQTRHLEEPIVIFAQDNSGSILMAAGRDFDADQYLSGKEDFLSAMQSRFDIRSYQFGESFRQSNVVDFNDRLTNIDAVFEGVEALYSNRNIGAVVLASDGLHNRGNNPLFRSERLPYPVYTIALGDTVPRRDLLISRVRHNRITYLGNVFPVEVLIEGREAGGMATRITVRKGQQVLDSREISFTSDHHLETVMFELEADEAGMQRYVVELQPIEGEVTVDNNTSQFMIDVLDGRQKVLLLSHAPHPDVGAIKEALQREESHEVVSSLLADFTGSVEEFNLVILHQLPASGQSAEALFRQLYDMEMPLLFVLGTQSDLNAFSALPVPVALESRDSELIEALPSLYSGFGLFTLPPQTEEMVTQMPPLFVPFARYEARSGAQVLFHQRIGQVSTEQPLVVFSQQGNIKTGVISGEGLWRWRLHNFLREGNHQWFDGLIGRLVQYMALLEDRSPFRIRSESFFYENEPVLFEAELYNPSFELVNHPDVELNVTNEEGITFSYIMGRTSQAYYLDAGSFEPGDYQYRATVTLGGEVYLAEGRFSVAPLNIESLARIADHNLLYQLSANSGGSMFYPNQWDALQQSLFDRNDIAPLMYTRSTLDEVINNRALFFILLMLLAIEWFVRKRSGHY